jgi:hypothetical protein
MEFLANFEAICEMPLIRALGGLALLALSLSKGVDTIAGHFRYK